MKKKRIIIAALSAAAAFALACAALVGGRLYYIDKNYGLGQWGANLTEDIKSGNGIRHYFVNNDKRYVVSNEEFETCDVKEIVKGGDGLIHMINHPRGYRIGFPEGTTFDFSASNEFIEAKNKD